MPDLLSHAACQRELRRRLGQLVPADEPIAFAELAEVVSSDAALWTIAQTGPFGEKGAAGQLHELIVERGQRQRELG